jgi:hypothetical protein
MGWIVLIAIALLGLLLGILEIVKGPEYDRRHGYGPPRFVPTRSLDMFLVCGSVMTAMFGIVGLVQGR